EAAEAGRIRHACDKPSTCSVIVVHGPIGAGQRSRRRRARGERERRNLRRLRWWNTQAPEELVHLVPLAVEEASEQENDDEHNRQADSPAFCEAAKVFMCVMHVVRFSHQYSIPIAILFTSVLLS